jgi:hypothetical protein
MQIIAVQILSFALIKQNITGTVLKRSRNGISEKCKKKLNIYGMSKVQVSYPKPLRNVFVCNVLRFRNKKITSDTVIIDSLLSDVTCHGQI